MPAGMKVHYETLFSAADEVSRASTEMTQASDTLKGDLAPLVNTWEGEAYTNYQALQDQWDQAHAELNQVLAKIGITLNEIGNSYREMEGQQARRFGG
ncbi:WXG100 family type VII secretion target [Haloechinothrix sp. LS1_15]|uniref:WXG100 family type VII secretion target n=1 Tax=Haloechinothrix sp. LS1_15 TaxID=2652248 RepID=UPI002946A51E|nr:WXG100 family type VII secretion target [Haloechinothrix sp. LS1_15]MDV6013089.1 WXG100 family type VII secretion target [Haloechinothrix sp. LS1_15]